MTTLIPKSDKQREEYLEDQNFPGYYGSYFNSDKIMLVRNFSIGIKNSTKEMYQWQTKDMCFKHIGRSVTIENAFKNPDQPIYKFDSLVELATWMEED